ncbi:hybrid sensor histidine kinase/response regulator, partial [Lysobacter sp. 2RAB21]
FLSKPVATSRLLDTLADIASSARVNGPLIAPMTRSTSYMGADQVLDAAILDELGALGMGEGFEREFVRQCLRDAEACVGALGVAGGQGDWDRVREHA